MTFTKKMTVRRDMSNIPLHTVTYKIEFVIEWDKDLDRRINKMRKWLRDIAFELLNREYFKDIIRGYIPHDSWASSGLSHEQILEYHAKQWVLERDRWLAYWVVRITKATLYRTNPRRTWCIVSEGEEIEF